jgi:tetratricopeptide (TPR) repeat protein
LSVESIEAVAQAATRAFRERRFQDAAAGYERCVAMSPDAPAFHFNLGTARELGGDLPGAIRAYLAAWKLNPKDGRLALFAGAALAAAGRREQAAILFSLGDDVDPAVRRAKDRPELDPEIRRRSATADRIMREMRRSGH